MKRRKRMGMCKALPALSSRAGVRTTVVPRAHVDAATPVVQIPEPMQSAFESTPEKFVAFVNRMTATEASPKSFK